MIERLQSLRTLLVDITSETLAIPIIIEPCYVRFVRLLALYDDVKY